MLGVLNVKANSYYLYMFHLFAYLYLHSQHAAIHLEILRCPGNSPHRFLPENAVRLFFDLMIQYLESKKWTQAKTKRKKKHFFLVTIFKVNIANLNSLAKSYLYLSPAKETNYLENEISPILHNLGLQSESNPMLYFFK